MRPNTSRRLFALVLVLAMMPMALSPAACFAEAKSTEAAPAGETPFPIRIRMLVTTEWLAEHAHDANVVILCIAESKDFYRRGHIPGARFIPLGDIAITRNGIPHELANPAALKKAFERAGVTNASRVVLYGERSGVLAARAYFTLDYLGLGNQGTLLNGGLEKWKAEKRPLSTETPRVTSTTLQITLNPSVLVSTAEMRSLLEKRGTAGKLAIIDARPPEEFSGKRLSKDVSKAGRIPGATNVYWMENLVSPQNPVIDPSHQLSALYRWAGADWKTRIVVYCRTGMTSSIDYFVAKYLGYDVSMYDGSFYEWSRAGLAVEKSAPATSK